MASKAYITKSEIPPAWASPESDSDCSFLSPTNEKRKFGNFSRSAGMKFSSKSCSMEGIFATTLSAED